MPDKIKNTYELAQYVHDNCFIDKGFSNQICLVWDVDLAKMAIDTYIAELLSDPTYVLVNILHGTINISAYDTRVKALIEVRSDLLEKQYRELIACVNSSDDYYKYHNLIRRHESERKKLEESLDSEHS
jgi:hypothetical protein